MKAPIFGTIVMATATFATAAYLPGWERPIYQAELRIVDASGSLRDTKSAEMIVTRRDDARTQSPTGATLILDGRTVPMSVVSAQADGCGSVVLEAAQVIPPNVRLANPLHMTWTDHTHRLCEDYRPYMYEITVKDRRGGALELVGNPEALMTIMGIDRMELDSIDE